jgi:hypothetical protein
VIKHALFLAVLLVAGLGGYRLGSPHPVTSDEAQSILASVGYGNPQARPQDTWVPPPDYLLGPGRNPLGGADAYDSRLAVTLVLWSQGVGGRYFDGAYGVDGVRDVSVCDAELTELGVHSASDRRFDQTLDRLRERC